MRFFQKMKKMKKGQKMKKGHFLGMASKSGAAILGKSQRGMYGEEKSVHSPSFRGVGRFVGGGDFVSRGQAVLQPMP